MVFPPVFVYVKTTRHENDVTYTKYTVINHFPFCIQYVHRIQFTLDWPARNLFVHPCTLLATDSHKPFPILICSIYTESNLSLDRPARNLFMHPCTLLSAESSRSHPVKYSVKQKLFICETLLRCPSWRKHGKFVGSILTVQCHAVIHSTVTKLRSTGSVLYKTKILKRRMVTE
jgi:hypothetical protein